MAARQSTRIASKLRQKEQEEQEVSHQPLQTNPPAPKRRKTASEATQAWKRKMEENDPERFAAYKETGRLASQSYRANMSDEQKCKNREQSRLRMQAMRARKKAEATTPAKTKTRAAQEDQRKQWRLQKQRQREAMSSQKKRRINEKRRAQYQEQKEKEASQHRAEKMSSASTQVEVSVSDDEMPADTRTQTARRQAAFRARKVMPNSPQKYFHTWKALGKNAPPAARRLIKEFQAREVDSTLHKIRKHMKKLAKKRTKASAITRKVLLSVVGKYNSGRATSKILGLHRNTVSNMVEDGLVTKKEEVKKLRKKEEEAADFFEQNSKVLPESKLVSKKTGKAASVLTRTLGDLFEEFSSIQEEKISFAHFAQCRPRHIHLMGQAKLRQCLCEYCTNVELKLRVINGVAARLNNACRVRHVYHAVDIVTCGRQDGAWQKSCAYRTCTDCSTNNMDNHLQPLLQHHGPLSWLKWESVAQIINGKRTSRKMLVRKQGLVMDLIAEVKTEVDFLAGHLFRADWQHRQFEAMRKCSPFPESTVGMVLDFAENFTCSYQDEVQAAHWHHQQVTVHPIVAYYNCPACEETTTESLVFISNDRVHDFNAVFRFTEVAIQHLKETRGLQLDNIIQWTDGCAAQYKSRGPFADISCALQDFGATLERNYFGSRHGKGPSDGESAVVKHHAATAVKNGAAIITDAHELFTYCVSSKLNKQPPEEGCRHFLWSFFWVPSNEIQRDRQRPVKTLKGTRSLHCVKCVEQRTILTRHLSCFCQPCQTGVGRCPNNDICGFLSEETLELQAGRRGNEGRDQEQGDQEQGDQGQGDQGQADQGQADQGQADQGQADQEQGGSGQDGQAPPQKPTVGSFVKVTLEGRQRSVPFFAKVTEVHESGELKLQYLKQRSGSNVYIWADEAWLAADHPVTMINPPRLAPGRGIAFIFEVLTVLHQISC